MKVITNVSYDKVAYYISRKKIVAIFQGSDESGPRALGNRSLLFDPTNYCMLDYVNQAKNREWYRPLAGSILLEDFSEWFENGSIKESPFMTFAIKVSSNKRKYIPAIVHKNMTCRVQTVTKQQNMHYYNLINAYKDLTGIPIVGNTSFNLAGQPIVHTKLEALETIKNSVIDYVYFPEKACLVGDN